MSTVMYAFRSADRQQLHVQVKKMKNLYAAVPFKEKTEIQVFEIDDGIVFRVLESGFALENKMWDHAWDFPTCNYDDRTDMPMNGWSGTEEIARELDKMIRNGTYEIIEIWNDNE